MDTVNEFLKRTYKSKYAGIYEYVEIRPRIVCKDGFSLSVQASDGMYCHPRINRSSNYSEVEVGYPSARPPETWKKYFDGEWQQKGFLGSLARIWEKRSNIWWALKEGKKGIGRFTLKYNTSLKDNATMSVYGYVPVKLVNELIEFHGGIDWDETLLVNAK